MTTIRWRLGSAESLLVGDAVLPLALPAPAHLRAESRVALQALAGVPIVPLVAADLVPPSAAVREVADVVEAAASVVDVELAVCGRGERRRVVWMVECAGRARYVRRAVDALSGELLARLPEHGDAAAILLSRRRGAAQCDLEQWARCVVGLPLAVELELAPPGECSDVWECVLGARREPAFA